MSGGGDTQTTTSTKELDPDVKAAMMKLWEGGQSVLGNSIGEPAYRVAGFTPDQLYGMDQTRFQLDNAQNNPAYRPQTLSAGGPSAAMFTGAGPMAQANAARLTGDAYKEFMNPYISGVIDPAIAKMRRQSNITDAGIGARAAAGAAYGGSRGALERSQNARALNEQVATLVPQLMSQGYDKATASAMTNASMQQQTGLANMQAENQGRLADASQRNAMSTSNAQQGNAFNLQNTEMMNRFNSSNANDIWSREQQAIQALMQSGALQQMLAQKGIDIPIESLKLLAGFKPQSEGSGTTTETKPDNSPSPLMQVLGMVANVAGAYMKSDEKTKTNVRKLGKDPQTGLNLYEYDDKGDIAAAKKSGKPMPPKRVSVMAQDMEKIAPEMVSKVGGTRIIKRI